MTGINWTTLRQMYEISNRRKKWKGNFNEKYMSRIRYFIIT